MVSLRNNRIMRLSTDGRVSTCRQPGYKRQLTRQHPTPAALDKDRNLPWPGRGPETML